MILSRKTLCSLVVYFSLAACHQSENNETQATETSTATSSLESLITPDVTQTTSGSIQDIWVLDSINKKAPDSNYFAHGTPYFDFNVDKNTITGHTGCNGLNGKLKVNGEKLTFDSLVLSSNEVCKDKGFEKNLLSGFRSGNTSYKILNDKLYLNVGKGSEFIFRRIRR